MVFAVDPESDKVMAAIRKADRVEEYECLISACDSPVCMCDSVYLDFSRPFLSALDEDDFRLLRERHHLFKYQSDETTPVPVGAGKNTKSAAWGKTIELSCGL